MTTRRTLIATALAAAATPAFAAAGKSVEVSKAFPYLENYWKLPAAERSRFVLAYYLSREGKPAAGLRGEIVQGSTRTPFQVGAGGRVTTLPTLAQIRAGAKLEFDVPASTEFRMIMAMEPRARPAAEMDAVELAACVAQASKSARKVAGVMGLAMPPINAVLFKGIASGTAILADGRALVLPKAKGMPVFEPSRLKTARTLRFPKAPAQLQLGPASG